MQRIEIVLTEENILKNTWYTVEQLAKANWYNDTVNINGEEKMNDQSYIDFIANISLRMVVSSLSFPLLDKVIKSAQIEAANSFNMAMEAVIKDAEVRVTE